MDMSTTISPKSDQLNADDLISGPRTITVTRVTANPGGNGADQPVNVFFEGDGNKPFRPCKSMRRVMVSIWGKDAAQYAGRSMTIYRDPEVTWGGMKVGGIRISHMSGMDKPEIMALTATQKQRKPYRVDPLVVERKPEAPSADDVMNIARSHAKKGKERFVQWWNSEEGKASRAVATPIMAELQELVAKADAAIDEDPFGLPPSDDDAKPSAEELAAAEAEARAAADAQDQEDAA